MTDSYYRKCGSCGQDIHKGFVCVDCTKKADPWAIMEVDARLLAKKRKCINDIAVLAHKIIIAVSESRIDSPVQDSAEPGGEVQDRG